MSIVPQQNVQIRRNGSHIGNFPLQSMRSLVSSGMILPTDHYLYEGMNDWQAVGETWAERPQPPAKEPAAAVADPSALKEYIVWYEDRPTGPRKIASHSPLNAAKDFALQSAHGAQEFVVCVRIDQAKDVHKFKRSAGVWSNMGAPFAASSVAIAEAPGTLKDLLARPPATVKRARQVYILWLWLGLSLGLTFAADQMGSLPPLQDSGMASVVVMGIMVVGFSIWLVYWTSGKLIQGKQWARVVIIVTSAGAFIPDSWFGSWPPTPTGPSAVVATLFGWGFAVVVIGLLAMPGSSDWFRKIRLLKDQELFKTKSET
jgi:hypothetical protein